MLAAPLGRCRSRSCILCAWWLSCSCRSADYQVAAFSVADKAMAGRHCSFSPSGRYLLILEHIILSQDSTHLYRTALFHSRWMFHSDSRDTYCIVLYSLWSEFLRDEQLKYSPL